MPAENEEFDELRDNKRILDELMIGFNKLPKSKDEDLQNTFEEIVKSIDNLLNDYISKIFDSDNPLEAKEVNEKFIKFLPIIVSFFKEHMTNVKNENPEDIDLDNGDFQAESKKTVSKVHPVEGKMHQLLGLKPEEDIHTKFKSGQQLYNALSRKIKDHSKLTGMLAYAANINKKKDVFDAALHYAKKVNSNKKDA